MTSNLAVALGTGIVLIVTLSTVPTRADRRGGDDLMHRLAALHADEVVRTTTRNGFTAPPRVLRRSFSAECACGRSVSGGSEHDARVALETHVRFEDADQKEIVR